MWDVGFRDVRFGIRVQSCEVLVWGVGFWVGGLGSRVLVSVLSDLGVGEWKWDPEKSTSPG